MVQHADIDHTGLTGVGVGDASAHIADATDAHDASAVSFDATALDNTSATEVQTALEDFDAAITAASGGTGGILAVNRYAPATTVYSVTSGTQIDVDATNMAVTFTAPASGNVIVTLSAWQDHSTNGANNSIWDLRESTTDLGVGGIINRNALQEGAYTTMTLYVTGISGGSHTYKWAFALTTAGAGTARIIVGPGNGGTGQFPPGIMVVEAAP